MFTVKAEVAAQEVGFNSFQLYQAAHVRAAKPSNHEQHPSAATATVAVELFDADGRSLHTLYVGGGFDHYCAVYVMNERGKTVESIYPGPRADGLARAA